MSFESGNWRDLPRDVWFSIGLKLDAPSDRIKFRAVSKSLRSYLPFRQPPCLMLAEYHDDSDCEEEDQPPRSCRRGFYFLGEQRYYKLELTEAHLARCVGSTNAWVITVKRDTSVHLLNTFSKLQIDFPSHFTPRVWVPPSKAEALVYEELCRRGSCLRKAIVYTPPSCNGRTDFTVIAIRNHGKLAMARPGDSSWTSFKVESKDHTVVQDIVVYEGLLYAITCTGLLLSSDIHTSYPDPPQLSVVGEFDIIKPDQKHQLLYLVEWCEHLLLVIKSVKVFGLDHLNRAITIPFYKTEGFRVFRFESTGRNWIEITSLGEYSLFLGYNTSVSVLASDYLGLVKKNCIYFTDDFSCGDRTTALPDHSPHVYRIITTPGGHDMGVFNLDDNSIMPHYKGESTSYYSPPIWIVPD